MGSIRLVEKIVFSFPDSLLVINYDAFSGCDSLTDVTIPPSVIELSSYSFNNCAGLLNINVDVANPFYTSISGVVFSDDLTEIFIYPNGRAGTYTIPSSVTTIRWSCFRFSSELTVVTIPNSVTAIDISAFYDCDKLTSIDIPAGVVAIGDGAFGDCDGLISINVDPGNTAYATDGGVLFNATLTSLIQCPASKSGVYNVPFGVLAITDKAFDSCELLSEIVLPASLLEIGDGAFNYCKGLTSLDMPNSVTSLGEGAFALQ